MKLSHYYVIMNKGDVTGSHIQVAINNDLDRCRHNSEGTQVLLKFPKVNGALPVSVGAASVYLRSQILTILEGSDWTD